MTLRFVLACWCLPVVGLAQTDFGVKGGLNYSDIVMTNYINPDVESDLKARPGLHAGFFVSGMVSEKLGMAAELMYSDKGITDIHLHYITLPLMLQHRLGKKLLAELGTAPAYMFSARSNHGDASS